MARGRKPKLSNEEILHIEDRLSAGDSVKHIAKDLELVAHLVQYIKTKLQKRVKNANSSN